MALWMFATIEAVSSARHLDRLCQRDLAYLWICGGVGVNYHMLSDFRTGHGEFLDQLLTDTIATLMHQNIVTLEKVGQDGMRVRASAGSGSFRREKTLKKCREEAAGQVQKLREESENESENESDNDADNESDNDASNARQKAAKERAARDRLERVDAALKNLTELQKEKRKKGSGKEARCSKTDPQARNMPRPTRQSGGDGGFRPAYNVQFATDGDARASAHIGAVRQTEWFALSDFL